MAAPVRRGDGSLLIGLLTIGTFAVIDNVFLDVVSRQQVKIDGLAGSGFTSMRTYVNVGLLFAGAVLSTFLALAGAVLAVVGGRIAMVRRSGSIAS